MNGLSNGAALVKRGRTYDIEDSRTTNRLHDTMRVLKSMGIEPTYTHGTRTYFDWAMAGSLKPDKHLCSLNGSGGNDCTITWPAWVTDDIFNLAYSLADRVLTEYGGFNRRAAEAHKAARDAARREGELSA